MKLIFIIKFLLLISSIIFVFLNWKIALLLFVGATIVHTIPFGPNKILSIVTGYLVIFGFIYFFIDWKIGLFFMLALYGIVMFRGWIINHNYNYSKKVKK